MPAPQNSKSTLDFLGTIGSKDRGDRVSLSHTAKALIDLADFLIGKAEDNLEKNGNVATGETIKSMVAREIQVTGTKMELDIEILSTYKFLDQGVRGVQGGVGKYSFKYIPAGAKMALAILKWIRKRGVVSKYAPYSTNPAHKGKTERKNKRIRKAIDAAKSLKSLAYAIATGIKKKGIKPTKFFADAVRDTKTIQKKKYGDALKLDIIESIKLN